MLRAVLVIGLGSDSYVEDFECLLELIVDKGSILLGLGGTRLEALVKAAEMSTMCKRLQLSALLLVKDCPKGERGL